MPTDKYISPLSQRYASVQMQYLFSADKKFSTWRRLWVALAQIENLMEREKAMDAIRFEWLQERTEFDFFSVEMVFASAHDWLLSLYRIL